MSAFRPRTFVTVAAVIVLGSAYTLLPVTPSSAAGGFSFRTTVLQNQKAYGEPSIAVADDNKHVAVCVPGGAGDTSVWYSADEGRSFGTSHTNAAGPNGGGDCELDYMPNGTLLNADLEISDSDIHYSKDFGKTWQGNQTAGVEQDRQWFAHSKDGKTAYLVYHDFAAEAELYAKSNDGGITWSKQDAANPVNGPDQVAPGGATTPAKGTSASFIDQGGNTFSGPMLISPDGRDMYVMYSISDLGSNTVGTKTPPYGPTRGIVVAHKGPEDQLFTNKYAVTSTDGKAVNGAIFPWGTVDSAGNVYVLYNSDMGSPGHFHTYYVFSTDKAKTWSDPVKVDDTPLAQGAQVYATGDGGGPGVIDVAWYGTDKATSPADNTAMWQVHFAQVRKATSASPQITRQLITADPIHKGNICLNGLLCILGGDRSLADFFELQVGPDGLANIAYADKATSPADNTAMWQVHFAQVRNATSTSPQITRQLIAADPIHKGNICLNGLLCILGGDRSLADFFELQVGPDGLANIAYADNVGWDDTKGHVVFAKQTSGPSAFSGVGAPAPATQPVAAVPPPAAPAPPATAPSTGSGTLASTGLAAGLPAAGLLVAVLAVGLMRRRTA